MIINNAGTDGGQGLTITTEGQALVRAEIEAEATHHSKLGETFIIGSGFVPLAVDANERGIFLLKNTSTTKNIYVGYLRTCSTEPSNWTLRVGGTGLSGTVTTPVAYNANRGSATTLDATIEGGAADSTISTNWGTTITQWTQNGPGHSIQPFEGSLILGPNDSIVITVDPAVGASWGSVNDTACISIQVWQV